MAKNATAENVTALNEITDQEAKEIMDRAWSAHYDLKKTTVEERCNEVRKVMDHFYTMRDTILDRVIEENGKSRSDAIMAEILGAIDYMEWIVDAAPKILKDEKAKTPLMLMGKKSKIYHESIGPGLIITPWNYPVNNGITFNTTGFIAGNAIIFKPSEHTPLKGLFEEIFSASPLMKNSIQIVYGSGISASKIIDQKPAKIFFTGSARTGKKIMAQCAEHLIPLELELGGKDPAIVFDDVNLNRTVKGILWGAMTNTGQSCTSVEKCYVHENIYDEFVASIKEECEKLVVNSHDQGDADVGAMTVPFQTDIVRRHVEDAKAKGATILCGGHDIGEGGKFFAPTVLTDIPADAALNVEETFGPLLPIYKFSSEVEVIKEANNTDFGLTASVWSADLDRADRVARALEVGGVSINNVMVTEGNANLPFGGRKESGFGKVRGAEGLLGWTNSKAIMVDPQSKKIEANWYPFTNKKYQLFEKLIAAIMVHNPVIRLIKIAIAGPQLEGHSQKPRD